MNIKESRIFWLTIFVLLFLLSLDYWNWGLDSNPSFLNIPSWIFYFGFLQFILAVAIFVFSKTYWRQSLNKKKDTDG
jgi:hypothetical protein